MTFLCGTSPYQRGKLTARWKALHRAVNLRRLRIKITTCIRITHAPLPQLRYIELSFERWGLVRRTVRALLSHYRGLRELELQLFCSDEWPQANTAELLRSLCELAVQHGLGRLTFRGLGYWRPLPELARLGWLRVDK